MSCQPIDKAQSHFRLRQMEIERVQKKIDANLPPKTAKIVQISWAFGQENKPLNKIEPQARNKPKTPLLLHQINRCIKNDSYYRLYAYLHDWLRKECVRFKHYRETYANAVCLMDRFYRQQPLERENFMPTVLCLMAISSKALDCKVLFISTLAKKNELEVGKMMQVEQELLFYFGFKINSYNFVRVLGNYLKLWDEEVLRRHGDDWLHLFFLRDDLHNYLLFEEVFHLCDAHLSYRKSLTQQRIKCILKFTIFERCSVEATFEVLLILDCIFAAKLYTEEQERLYSYEIDDQSDESALLAAWRAEFLCTSDALRKRYTTTRGNHRAYSEFLSLLP